MTFDQYLTLKYSSKSKRCYLYLVKGYKNYNRDHKKGTLQHILGYLRSLRDQGKHPKTLRNHLHAIKMYYDYLQHTGKRKDHPCKKIQLKDKIDKRIKITQLYSKKQLDTYLEQTPKHRKLMVSLLVYQALTASELVGLKNKHINIEKAEIQLENRTLPIKAVQMLELLKRIKGKDPEGYLFLTRTKKAYQASEINSCINTCREKEQKITPLKIRQSVIKNLLNHHDIRVVQVFAGHRTSATTAQYQANKLEALQQQIDRKHPLS